jgi:ferritin
MSSYCEKEGYRGAANWFYAQTLEEMAHAHRFYNYINSQGGHAVMQAIEQPPAEFDSYKALFEGALEHEQFITKCINDLVDLAREQKDHATEIMLQWFVTEQVEEEEHVGEILDQLNMLADSKNGLFMVDRELGARTFTPPAEEAD